MSTVTWSSKRPTHESGLDRGVLYPETGPGVAWNGLISVDDAHIGGEIESLYSDGILYLNLPSGRNYQARLTAFSAPKEFDACNGDLIIFDGLIVTRQPRQRFGLSYRNLIGNELGYKLHLVYNALATPTSRGNSTLTNTPNPNIKAWSIDAVPIISSAPKPTAHYIIDSTKIDSESLAVIEGLLYGTDTQSPYLPDINQIVAIISQWDPQIITPDYISGISELSDGLGDVIETDIDGIYLSLPNGRLSETGVNGFYQLMG